MVDLDDIDKLDHYFHFPDKFDHMKYYNIVMDLPYFLWIIKQFERLDDLTCETK